MAAGESPLQNGQQEASEDDNDWSDFASDSSNINSALCFGEQLQSKSLPSRNSGTFSTVFETTRVCFQDETGSDSRDSHTGSEDRGENQSTGTINILEESSCSHCRRSSQFIFPHPLWRGSRAESCLLKSLSVKATTDKEKETQEIAASPTDGLPGLFNFHRLAARNIELWQSSSKTNWDSVDFDSDLKSNYVRQQLKGSQQNALPSLVINDSEPSEFTDDLEVWSDSESGEVDEIFLLYGERQHERPKSFDECQAAAGLHHLSYEELVDLRDEMAAYVKEYSDVLVDELIVKDEQLREKEIKNVFISSLLTLQSRLREVQSKSNQGKKKNGPSANKYLTTIIPYEEQVGGLKTADLEKVIEIMDAMSEDSPTVPNLLTEYILKVLCP